MRDARQTLSSGTSVDGDKASNSRTELTSLTTQEKLVVTLSKYTTWTQIGENNVKLLTRQQLFLMISSFHLFALTKSTLLLL